MEDLLATQRELMKLDFLRIQAFVSRKAKEKGICGETDLARRLKP